MTILKTLVKCDNCGVETDSDFEGWTGRLGNLLGLETSGFGFNNMVAYQSAANIPERHYCPGCNQVVKDAQIFLDAALKARAAR